MAFLLHLFISMSLCQKQRVKLFTVDSSYCVHQDNTARPASHVSLEHQGSRWWIISYSLALSLVPGPGENPWAILVLLRLCDIKDIRHSFITSEILHVVWKEPLSVCVSKCVFCEHRKWVTVKNVTNSDFNCHWEAPPYLWVLSIWTAQQGLSTKACFLSQLKSSLTRLQPEGR